MGKHKNHKQEEIIVTFMKEHPEMANGFPKGKKVELDFLWERLTKEINKFGPPVKESSDWKKSWVDWKANIRRKLNYKNGENCRSDLSNIRLTNAEEFIVKLCCLNEKFEVENSRNKIQNDDVVDDTSLINIILGEDRSNCSSCSSTSNRSSLKRKRETSSQENLNDFLSSETSFQEDLRGFPQSEAHSYKDFSKALEGISRSTQNLLVKTEDSSAGLKRICRTLNNFCSLQVEKNKEVTRHNKMVEELLREKNMIKMRSLELQELQFKLEQEKRQPKTFIKCEIE